MIVADAQQEVRRVYLGGSVGQMVSGAIWLASAALGTWAGKREAIWMLVLGGAFIFPITQLVLRVSGHAWSLSRENPLRQLAMQVAFIVPLTLPVVGAAALHNVNWFYPGCMIIVGAHYLPFIFLYGDWRFGVVAAALLGGGVALGMARPNEFVLGGWLTGLALVIFSVALGIGSGNRVPVPSPRPR